MKQTIPFTKPQKNWLMLLLCCIFITTCAQAQQPDEELTLQKALQYALKANQDARKARLDQENAGYEIEEVRSGALPQISGNASLNYNPILQQSALPGDFVGQPGTTLLVAFGQKWNANAGVNVSQALFDKSVFTGLKAAKSTQEYYRLQAQLTEEQVIENVASLYYQILIQRQKIAVVDSNIKNTTRVRDIITGQFENGLAKRIDVDRTKVNLSNLHTQRQQLLNQVILAENELKFAMGMPIQLPIVIPAKDRSADALGAAADADFQIGTRLEYRTLTQQAKLLEFQKEAYKAEYYPSLSLSGNYSYQGLGNRFPLFKGTSQGVNWFDYASMGLTLKIPIFNGFATRARVRKADVSIRKLNEDLSKMSLSLNKDFENAKMQITNNQLILKTQEENAALAKEVYFNVMNNYNQGLASLTDLINSENEMTESQNNYSSALLDYRIAQIQLLKAQGQLKSLLVSAQ
ncbi:TolC family protein [Terrimonas sp. NA20]|uniref:TolC family protein n=1 Tax=Terrimonas ginsenosidimutans TaxID=2908004 RepID=A0ABS9KW43_9BACT|nr:TolC family protein [Terrimonas ginsenosidimutans]MCG2616582.1 TolC family protein [Terrimonas ginsenosidimutans]